MGDKADLTVALQAQNARDTDAGLTDKVINEIKSSVVFQYNWEDLVQSAPVAVSSAGACYAACFGDAGMRVRLEPPPSGQWKYLDSAFLSDALVRCGDLGRVAFLEAETGMAQVKSESDKAENKVGDIIGALASSDPQDSALVEGQMNLLKTTADTCLAHATEIDQRFDAWLMYTMELHAACIGTESSDEEKARATSISLVVEQSRFDSQKSTVEDAKAASEQLGKQLNVASEAFKKASDNFPSGWDILGQQVVGALADCATTALGQLMTAYTSNMNPMAKASTGLGMFSEVIHGNKSDQDGKEQSPQEPPPPAKVPVPASSQDPAYSAVQKDMPYINTLHILLTSGKDSGVNWDEASGSSEEGAASQSAEYVRQMLQDATSTFEGLATIDQPSTDLKGILSTCLDISTAIVSEAKKGTAMSNHFPQADSAEVKDWQTRLQSAYEQAQKMVSLAKALPGGTAAGVPLMANTPDPNEAIAKTNAKSAQAQATLEAAKNRLSTTQDCFLKTQQLYADNTKILLDQENKLTDVQAELKKLNETKLGLEEVKSVLEACIKLIVNVKTQVMNLVSFFKAISASIDDVVKFNVSPFIEQITAIANGSGHTKTIGPFTFTDYQRSLVYSSAVTIRSHFSVFGDIADMWVRLSIQNIKPGLALVDKLTIVEPDLAKRQAAVRDLQQWADGAIESVKKIAHDTQAQLIGEMIGRVQDVEKTTKQIPASPPMLKAIQAGAGEVKQAAEEAIKANAAARPLSRFAPKQV